MLWNTLWGFRQLRPAHRRDSTASRRGGGGPALHRPLLCPLTLSPAATRCHASEECAGHAGWRMPHVLAAGSAQVRTQTHTHACMRVHKPVPRHTYVYVYADTQAPLSIPTHTHTWSVRRHTR